MTIEKTVNGNEITLALKGWLDTQASSDLVEALGALGDQCEKLVFDLSELEYISSSGVRQIVAAHKQMGGELYLRNTPDNVMSVFKAIGIDRKLKFQ
jgi:anti-anti-sigma factor